MAYARDYLFSTDLDLLLDVSSHQNFILNRIIGITTTQEEKEFYEEQLNAYKVYDC